MILNLNFTAGELESRTFILAVSRQIAVRRGERMKHFHDTGSRFDFHPGDSPYPENERFIPKGLSHTVSPVCESTAESNLFLRNVPSFRTRARVLRPVTHRIRSVPLEIRPSRSILNQ